MAANSQFAMAVHVLTMLAQKQDENVKSDCIAASVNTNAVVIRRLLGQLHHAGLVVSQTGASGGTRLSRSPEEIDLAQVYDSLSCGEVFALHPRQPNRDCPVGRNIESVLCNLQKEIDRTIDEKLARYKLSDIIGLIEQGKEGTSKGAV
jgi:Rrf2 family protein